MTPPPHTFPNPRANATSGSKKRPRLAGRTPRQVAAEWLQREESGRLGPEEQAKLDAWLDADPRHRAALESVRYVYGLSDGHAAAPNIMSLR